MHMDPHSPVATVNSSQAVDADAVSGGSCMGYWQKPPMERDQIVLFAPTLEARIPEDHPVRLLDEILAGYDWSAWEAHYHGSRGQPPIHPRFLAAAILYGFTRGIRSSRKLEYAIGHSIDFIWLVEGRSIDHSTICEFRTEFKKPLKDLYRHVCRIAAALGLIRLNDMALDGTRGRTVSRDIHEKRRQEHAEKMATPEAQQRYQKRFHTGEVPFAILKQVMNLRRFLLRGLENVKTEWLWGCTAFNLAKLIRHTARLRAQFAAPAGTAAE
jgi:transposase